MAVQIPTRPSDPNTIKIWDRVYQGVLDWRARQDAEHPHVVPSASATASCVKQNVYAGRRIPRTNEVPVQSIIKMEGGVRMEGFWYEVLELAGFGVQAHPDETAYEAGIPDKIPGTPDGIMGLDNVLLDEVVLELKNLGVWGYANFVQKGLKEAEYGYYAQVQSYMHSHGLGRAVLIAGMADSSAMKWIWMKIKKQDEPPPPFWIEVVDYDPAAFKQAQESARTVDYFVTNPDIPMANVPKIWNEGAILDPALIAADGKMPCGYCGWAELCIGGKR